MKQFIINIDSTGQIFGLLVINSNNQGTLYIYQSNAEGTVLSQPEYAGVYVEIFDEIIDKAAETCVDNNATLIKY